MSGQLAVDVVVDVSSARVDGFFTYLVGADDVPGPGARVRVPFNGRVVGGWVVGSARNADGLKGLKAVLELDPASTPLDASALALATWMRRRYACTFREALTAVALRPSSRSPRASYAFVEPPSDSDRAATTLWLAFAVRPFALVTARGVLRQAGIAMTLQTLRGELDRLLRHRLAVRVALPAAKKREAAKPRRAPLAAPEAAWESALVPATTDQNPTAEQQAAIESLDSGMRRGPFCALLQGVTGSGKTLVYARLIDRVRRRGGRAIVLVPEIILTPQTALRLQSAFGSAVGVLHSGLADGEKRRVWSDAAAGSLDVVVGARSAAFVPLPSLQLVVVDEEHEPSYKQDIAPRYDAGAVAQRRMGTNGGAVIFGSATPSLESYQRALSGDIAHVRMIRRATAAPLPPVEIVDMSSQSGSASRRPLSARLVAAMEKTLRARQKALLFINRRGYAGLLLCRSCGFAPRCRRCAVSLVIHTADASMRCHVCGAAFRIPRRCPKCKSEDLRPFGFGTQRVEEEVRELFPHANVVRMDSDSTSGRGAHAKLLQSFGDAGDVLIGTQMIAKGLDFPAVTLVGVVAADIDLNRPDFRAAERTFSLLTQVAGRAGRAAAGSSVIVQTFSPEQYAVRLAAQHDFDGFAAIELASRRELRYPPFGRLAYVGIAGTDSSAVSRAAGELAQTLRGRWPAMEVLGPAPDPLSKAHGEFRMRIALKSETEAELLEACAEARDMRSSEDARRFVIVDPR
ncbi:MAG: primosomal protein N' [Candidatus Eremiobacteraeota bacterium]|nr:primosomal protein N' [Candidatus Eremiobacteraeota bacterium]MBC5827425.1 primosomal protein N' [Candidatus Eremiobacteraeota bacterium]